MVTGTDICTAQLTAQSVSRGRPPAAGRPHRYGDWGPRGARRGRTGRGLREQETTEKGIVGICIGEETEEEL